MQQLTRYDRRISFLIFISSWLVELRIFKMSLARQGLYCNLWSTVILQKSVCRTWGMIPGLFTLPVMNTIRFVPKFSFQSLELEYQPCTVNVLPAFVVPYAKIRLLRPNKRSSTQLTIAFENISDCVVFGPNICENVYLEGKIWIFQDKNLKPTSNNYKANRLTYSTRSSFLNFEVTGGLHTSLIVSSIRIASVYRKKDNTMYFLEKWEIIILKYLYWFYRIWVRFDT